MSRVLGLIHFLYVLKWLPTNPLQGKLLWTPMHLSNHEGVCSRHTLELAPVSCSGIWDAKWSVNYFLKGCMVHKLEKGLLFLYRGHWSRQTETHFLVKSVSDIKPGEIVSECNALKLCLPVLAPWDQIRHRPWTPFSSEVIKSWGASGTDDTALTQVQEPALGCMFLK